MKTYRIVFLDNTGSRAVEALAASCGGAWRNAVTAFDGVLDQAIIDVPDASADHLESLLDDDANVVQYAEQ
jgi:hypothetical protein